MVILYSQMKDCVKIQIESSNIMQIWFLCKGFRKKDVHDIWVNMVIVWYPGNSIFVRQKYGSVDSTKNYQV
jgi:hypothetical protein